MNDQPQPPPLVPLEVAKRIHQKCEHFEDAWNGPTRPQFDAFLIDALEPERSWLLAELLALEVELRRGAGEQPTEEDYRQSFPGEGDRTVIAAAFQRCAEPESASLRSHQAERDDYDATPVSRTGQAVTRILASQSSWGKPQRGGL